MPEAVFLPRRLGPYRVERELASGAMGAVYLATHIELDRQVALKLLRPSSLQDPESLQRFRTEARSAARLDHPNIVPVYDAGELDGVPYIAMKLLDGENLHSLLARTGPLPPGRVSHIAAQLARALDYAHGCGVVHLDVKPMNVMVTRGDRVVLSDFGIAEALRPGGAPKLTVIGTPLYMAPERIQGQNVDGRSDVYSLGVVMYEMCAGHPPFAGDCATVTHMHLHTPAPDVRAARPELPEALVTIISRALAKDPSGRFQTAGDLLQALERATPHAVTAGTSPTTVRAVRPRADASGLLSPWRPGLATVRIGVAAHAHPPTPSQGKGNQPEGGIRTGRGLALAICALALMFGTLALLLSHVPTSQHAQASGFLRGARRTPLPMSLWVSGQKGRDGYPSGATVTLRWTGMPQTRVYRLQLAVGPRHLSNVFRHPLLTDLVEGTSRSVRVLGPHAYAWRVQALVNSRWGPYTAPQNFTVAPPAIGTPRLLSPENGASYDGPQVRLCWSPVSGAAGYLVRVGGLEPIRVRGACTWLSVQPRTYAWSVAASVRGVGLYIGLPSPARRFTVRRPPSLALAPPPPTPVPRAAASPSPTEGPPRPVPTLSSHPAPSRRPAAKADSRYPSALAPPASPTARPTVTRPSDTAANRSLARRPPTVGPTASPGETACDPEVEAC